MSAVALADARPASPTKAQVVNLTDAPNLFSSREVLAALAWKYGRAAEYVDIPSVWQLLTEFRALNRNKEAKQ